MDNSPRLGLPYLVAQQAMKHITHNEALKILDVLVQPVVASRTLTAPPADPQEGDGYVVAPGGTVAWAGRDGTIAAFSGGAWVFLSPVPGWQVFVTDAGQSAVFAEGGWQAAGTGGAGLERFGVHTDADATNRLAAAAPATLLTHEGAGHQLKINKASAADTGSVLFQTGWSGRAEFGLAGDDDWHVKVSPDGSTWTEALVVDKDTGVARFPAGIVAAGVREVLSADRTYYVDAANGSDSNDGLSGGTAFASLQAAWDAAAALDLTTRKLTISVADGTYTAKMNMSAMPVGGASITITGNTANPSDCHIDVTTSAFETQAPLPCPMTIRGFKISAAGVSVAGVRMNAAGTVTCQNMEAAGGSSGYSGFYWAAAAGAKIIVASGQAITGDMSAYVEAQFGGQIQFYGIAVTLTGTPDFSWNFAVSTYNGLIIAGGVSFSGGGTGGRYSATINSAIQTNGAGETLFPGDSAGAADTSSNYL